MFSARSCMKLLLIFCSDILEKMLHSDLKDIWDDIKKPTKFADSKASEFFKFVVVGIPSKLAEPKAYDSAVSSLRKRSVASIHPLLTFVTCFYRFIQQTGIDIHIESPKSHIPISLILSFAYAASFNMSTRWLNEEAPTEYSRRVPADGFAYYAQQIWLTILNSAELDIPSQKEMVASYR